MPEPQDHEDGSVRSTLIALGARLGRGATRMRVRLRRWLGLSRPPRIVLFRGYGSRTRVRVKGRVEERPRRPPSEAPGSTWRVFRESVRRVAAPPVPDARLRVEVGGSAHEVGCSVHGYFDAWLSPSGPLEDGRPWHPTAVALAGAAEVRAEGEILTPTPAARFVVVSDIDDTVVPTGATSFLRMLATTFLTDARARLAFPGVGAFYRALHRGPGGEDDNPLVYVSRGPWSLYEVLAEMLRRNAVPTGPVLFLRKWGLSEEGLRGARTRGHKFAEISSVLEAFADLPAVLIGDSGQRDPEIYAEVVRAYPGRVLAAYIRTVECGRERRLSLARVVARVQGDGSGMVLADDTVAMAEDAAARGLIDRAVLPEIAADNRRDAGPAGGRRPAPP